MMRQSIMIKKGILYIILNYIIQLLNIILSLVFMRYLSPSMLGDLSLARTWQQLVDYSHFGTRFSLDRYVPTAEYEEKKELLTTVMLTTLFGGFLILISSIAFNDTNKVVTLLSATGLFMAISNILKTYLRASNQISEMLKIVLFAQLFPILISLSVYLITKIFSYYLYSTLIIHALTVSYIIVINKHSFIRESLKKAIEVYKRISYSSLLLFINSICVFLYLVMDRFFIDYSSGRDVLGNYSVITFAFSALMIVPATVTELLYVKIIKQSSLDKKIIFIKEPLIVLSITILSVIIANPIMSFFITKFTSYSNLLYNMHYATLAVIPFSLTSVYFHVLNGLDLRKQMVIVNTFTCITLLVLYLIPIIYAIPQPLSFYINIKILTGCLVFAGYISVLLMYRKKYSKITH